MKKGMIFMPPRFYKYFMDWHKILFGMIAEEFNFSFNVSNTFGVLPKDLDMLIFYSNPHSSNELMDLGNIPTGTKVIKFCDDLHAADVLANYRETFKRANVIIGPYAIAFKNRFPQYISKFVPFRHFFAPDERYTALPYNKGPIMKCLLTGAAYNKHYPLRMVIKNALAAKDRQLRDFMEVNWHSVYPMRPGETAPAYGDEYAKRLNAYFCGIASSSKNHYTVSKYVEIPAAGSLLLANQTPDSDDAGFVPHRHYVPVTNETVIPKIKEVLSKPAEYEAIRKQGMEFVRDNFSIKNRFEQLKTVIQKELI